MTSALILSTWLVWAFATVGIGLALTTTLIPLSSRRLQLQVSIWLGLLTLAVAILVLNFLAGIASTTGATLAALWIVGGWVAFVVWMFKYHSVFSASLKKLLRISNWPALILGALIASSLIVAAFFAAAEPMDADAGIYRMGSINYAAQFHVIPGLANLHDRFGFNSLLWPVAALFENGLWLGNGFRIVTGFFFTLFVIDILFRTVVPRQRTPGDYYSILALAFLGWVALSDSGRWIPSPAQDVVAFLFFSVAVAYLLDFVNCTNRNSALAAVSIIAASLAGAVRPLGWLLLFAILLATLFGLRIKPIQRHPHNGRRLAVAASIGASLLGTIMLARDVILSGWLLYPIDFLAMPVDWIAPKPTLTSQWITAYARDPNGDAESVLASNAWLETWIPVFISSRELRFLVLVAAAAMIPILWKSGRRAWWTMKSTILLGLIPATFTMSAWFITAPDVRFGWGPLLSIVAVPLAALLSAHAYPKIAIYVIFYTLLIVGIATNFRSGRFELRGGELTERETQFLGINVTLNLADSPEVKTYSGQLADGTPVTYAVRGGCYNEFPLCLLPDSGSQVVRRGTSLQDGFRLIHESSP